MCDAAGINLRPIQGRITADAVREICRCDCSGSSDQTRYQCLRGFIDKITSGTEAAFQRCPCDPTVALFGMTLRRGREGHLRAVGSIRLANQTALPASSYGGRAHGNGLRFRPDEDLRTTQWEESTAATTVAELVRSSLAD